MSDEEPEDQEDANEIEQIRHIMPSIVHLLPFKSISDLNEESSPSAQPKGSIGLIAFGSLSDLETIFKVFKRRTKLFTDEKGRPFKIGLCYDSR